MHIFSHFFSRDEKPQDEVLTGCTGTNTVSQAAEDDWVHLGQPGQGAASAYYASDASEKQHAVADGDFVVIDGPRSQCSQAQDSESAFESAWDAVIEYEIAETQRQEDRTMVEFAVEQTQAEPQAEQQEVAEEAIQGVLKEVEQVAPKVMLKEMHEVGVQHDSTLASGPSAKRMRSYAEVLCAGPFFDAMATHESLGHRRSSHRETQSRTASAALRASHSPREKRREPLPRWGDVGFHCI
mmetsp:Transcript_26306/g.43660  ORF Transcript_26306/g.43660 Transcript_26306/m.43660 type:complete len:240 (+) Transcript_26306:135-854(+)|eukprot:CAMPEP_0119313150 /NCGR_PEP_ID=MMETSP1333-20130426/28061_1 /TAXON_ID=418940 /ORGANISM="Scyphosphaera apsteinii, Strain RCC1455" /LENGTH=239 /DNA_ID=CAMNT_0007317909 /DNA_START=135 /DNA_END=854 /DNA_ORIENTATION=-